MAKGGARARSGPAPDPNALRRDRDKAGDWLSLPEAGRPGPPPQWPLIEATERESILWERLWSLPQAVEWERQHLELEVAMHVRTLAEAEQPGSIAALRTLVRQQSEALGLSVPGMLRNRWRIDRAEQPGSERRLAAVIDLDGVLASVDDAQA